MRFGDGASDLLFQQGIVLETQSWQMFLLVVGGEHDVVLRDVVPGDFLSN